MTNSNELPSRNGFGAIFFLTAHPVALVLLLKAQLDRAGLSESIPGKDFLHSLAFLGLGHARLPQ
jgi:hypothetical protein